MVMVSKNYKLGRVIQNLSEICQLAKEGKSICFRHPKWKSAAYNMKPAAFIQNWSIETASHFEFWTIEKID